MSLINKKSHFYLSAFFLFFGLIFSSPFLKGQEGSHAPSISLPLGALETSPAPKPRQRVVPPDTSAYLDAQTRRAPLTLPQPKQGDDYSLKKPNKAVGDDPCKQQDRINSSDIRFMGNSLVSTLTAEQECIVAYNDTEASLKAGEYYFKNPANPNYTIINKPRIQNGRSNYNPLGYYLRVPKKQENRKQYMCAKPKDPNGQEIDGVVAAWMGIRFQPYSTNLSEYFGDGECVCGDGNLTAQNEGLCTGEKFSAALAAVTSRQSPSTTAQSQGTAGNQTTEPQVLPAIDSQFKQCIDEAALSATRCDSISRAARLSCRQTDDENSTSKSIRDILGAGSQAVVMTKHGTGVQSECFAASVMAKGAIEMIRGTEANCIADVETCRKDCSEETFSEKIESCASLIGGGSVSLLNDENNKTAEAVYFRTKSKQMEDNFSRANNICNNDLKNIQNDISRLLDETGRALQSSLKCACQTSTTGQILNGDCNSIPSIQNCVQKPETPGCDTYSILDVCVPGHSGYDAKTCSCMQNPSSEGCAAPGGGQPPPTLFGANLRPVGSGFAGGGSGGVGGSSSGGGARASGLDLSGGGPEEVAQTELRKSSNGSGNSSGPSGGGGPGGGVGGSGNGAPEEGPVAAVQEETGLKGLFNQARNAVMNAFGKASGNTRSPRSAAADETGGKKRNLRGLASGSDIGSKNMDIWRMVNMCANGETCVSNRNNYVENP